MNPALNVKLKKWSYLDKHDLQLIDKFNSSCSENINMMSSANSKCGNLINRDRDNIFSWIDPIPAHPPSYNDSNPCKKIHFPIYEPIETYILPSYSAAIEQITIVSMKLEWITPYEPSQSRNWKNFIMEINSTQLNFYYIDESFMKDFKLHNGNEMEVGKEHLHNIMSLKSHSHSMFKLGTKNDHELDQFDQQWISSRIQNDREKYLSQDKLFRSYSLYLASYGIPKDYIKKTFVLRVRCELEQFLLSFTHVDDMIEWSMYLSIGINLSPDLDFREFPNYVTLPRRRRNRETCRSKNQIETARNSYTNSDHSTLSLFFNRSRSSSILSVKSLRSQKDKKTVKSKNDSPIDEITFEKQRNRSFTDCSLPDIKLKLKSIFKSEKTQSSKSIHLRSKSISESNYFINENNVHKSVISCSLQSHSKDISYVSLSESDSYNNLLRRTSNFELCVKNDSPNKLNYAEEEHVIDNYSSESGINNQNILNKPNEQDVENCLGGDLQSIITSIYQNGVISPYKNDDYIYLIEPNNGCTESIPHINNTFDTCSGIDYNIKWNPPKKEISRKKYIRDSLRCIRIFEETDSWTWKTAVQATSHPSYKTNNPPLLHFKPINQKNEEYSDGVEKDEIIHLTKCKNHYLKLYIIGPTQLMTPIARN